MLCGELSTSMVHHGTTAAASTHRWPISEGSQAPSLYFFEYKRRDLPTNATHGINLFPVGSQLRVHLSNNFPTRRGALIRPKKVLERFPGMTTVQVYLGGWLLKVF